MRLPSSLPCLAAAGLACLAPASGRAAVPDIAFERYHLANGLDVILHVDHRVPIAHVELWYKVGSMDEAPGKTGFAHLFEHMMFQGTKHIPEDAFFKYLAQAGASARNGSTSTDRTNYFETVPASQLELALWLESSRMGFLLERPSWRETFANQRDVVKNERRQRVENVPLGAARALELETLFPPGHPYRHEVIGSMEDLDRATEADLKDFYGRYYAPNNAVLLIAGDIDPPLAKGMIDKYFGPIPAGPPVERPVATTVPRPEKEKRLVLEAKLSLPRGRMLWNTVPVFAPGDAEADMVASILGQGKGSRLYQRLVYDLKLAQSVTVYHASRALGGAFEIAYTAMQGHTLAEIEKAIDEELGKLQAEGPTAAEVDRARNQTKTGIFRGMEPLAGLAMRLLYYDVFAGDPAYLRRDLERYDQATPETLRTWAKKLLDKNARLVTSVAANPQAPIMGRLVNPATAPKPDAGPPVSSVKPTGKPTGKPTASAARVTPDAPFRAKLPPAGPTRPFKIPAVKRLRLRNGLAVILAESHKLPLVSVNVVVKTGSSANPKDKPGLASLTANMLDEGTTKRNATEIAREITQLGATLATYAAWDASAASLGILSDNLERGLTVWADVLLHPNFPQTELERVAKNLVATLAQRQDSPPVVANQVYSRALWGDAHPFAWPDIGTEASLKKLDRTDVKRFYDTYFVPNNAVLVVSGDITEKELRAKLEPLLAGWKSKKVPPVRVPKVAPPEQPRIVLVDKPGAPQTSLRIGLPGIERKHPDYYRALVTNHILGGTFKRLTMNLRETKGWTYGVTSQFDARRTPGPWTVAGEFVAAHTADAVEEIGKEIEKLRADPVTDQELADAKDEIAGAFPAKFATAALLAGQMAALAVYDLPARELDTFVNKIRAVSKKDVTRTARKYMRPDELLIVAVGDRQTIESSLRKLAEVERRDLDGNVLEPAK
jgi:zinc protease